MRRCTSGFTFTEIMIALVVGSVLTSVAVQNAGPVLSETAVRGAAQTFSSLHARARAHAVERGVIARLRVDTSRDNVTVMVGSDTIEIVTFGASQGVDIQAAAPTITLCINPRGFGERGCSSFESSVSISFVQGAKASEVTLWPLGQLRI